MITELIFELVTTSEEETETVGERLAALFKGATTVKGEYPVIALEGELGAGKTAFVRGFVRALSPGDAVRSPTYTVVNEYTRGNTPIFHFDMYRISGEDDLYSVGYDDYLRRGISIIEWSENVPFALPQEYTRVIIDKTGENSRKITALSVKS